MKLHFIELHHIDGRPIAVNLAHVMDMEQFGEGCVISLSGDGECYRRVAESYVMVTNLIRASLAGE